MSVFKWAFTVQTCVLFNYVVCFNLLSKNKLFTVLHPVSDLLRVSLASLYTF